MNDDGSFYFAGGNELSVGDLFIPGTRTAVMCALYIGVEISVVFPAHSRAMGGGGTLETQYGRGLDRLGCHG